MVDRTSPEYQVHLEKIAGYADMMNRHCDRITDEIRAVEADLNKTNIGIEVESKHPFHMDDIADPDDVNKTIRRKWFLGYNKADRWYIVVREVYFREVNEETVLELKSTTPLTNASRTLRIAAHASLDDLVATIAQEAERRANELM